MSRFPTMELQPTGLDHSRDANSTKPGPQVTPTSRVARTHRLRSGRGFAPECEGQYFKVQIEKCKFQIEEDAPRKHRGHGVRQPVILNRPTSCWVGPRVAGAGAASRSPGDCSAADKARVQSTSRVTRTHRLRGGRGFAPECEGQYFKVQIEKCKLKSGKSSPRRLPDTGRQA